MCSQGIVRHAWLYLGKKLGVSKEELNSQLHVRNDSVEALLDIFKVVGIIGCYPAPKVSSVPGKAKPSSWRSPFRGQNYTWYLPDTSISHDARGCLGGGVFTMYVASTNNDLVFSSRFLRRFSVSGTPGLSDGN